MLASDQQLTTWFYIFNYHQSITINREHLLNDILSVGKFSKWRGISPNTIKRDIDCFLRTYTISHRKSEVTEDSIECPLAELGLINATYAKNEFEIQRGPKSTLSDKIFEFALELSFKYFMQEATVKSGLRHILLPVSSSKVSISFLKFSPDL